MARVRRAAAAALVVLVALASLSIGAPSDRRLSMVADLEPRPLVAVPWPAAPAIVLAEVVTGGASASDEYVEVTNASGAPVDLIGLELVYVTSTGSTVTRKATWASSRPLMPGQHLLIANASGAFAAQADATYTGGFAATGGALAIRPVGGTALDAIGWGDATNAFVEGTAAPAPPAGSSLERRPGGSRGNVTDTNDNAADWIVVGSPVPQGLASPPTPVPSQAPSDDPAPSPSPAVSATPSTSPTPTPSPTVLPSPTSTPSPTPTPSPSPTPLPTPTPTPTPSPTPSPTPTPTPVTSIAAARVLPDGAAVTVEGVVTIGLGSLESGRSGFVQDATGGIAVYLDAPTAVVIAAGRLVRVAGSMDDRYAQRTVRHLARHARRPGIGEPARSDRDPDGRCRRGPRG